MSLTALNRTLGSLRAQLALVGFAAIYVPALLVLAVATVTDEETTTVEGGLEVTTVSSVGLSPWVTWTVVGLAPVAAAVAWWWAGRATRPIDRVRRVAEDIEASDLGRRIGLRRGTTEVVALAAAFDAMLDRLEAAAEAQRRLVEETSHELRTPLAVLGTNADVLLAAPEATEDDYREGIARSRQAAIRLERTIDALLVEARGRARTIDRRPADVVAVARAAVDDARTLAAVRGVDVTLASPAGQVTCPIDVPSVSRAVANLLDNAVRHAPAGSTVEVDVGGEGTLARVVVTDRGPGIPPDQQARVFQRFWRGADGGAGLGLPIATQVAEAHGGTLTVTSPLPTGSGCAFRLTLRG